MARIPLAATLLLTGKPTDLQQVLIAAILSMSEEDDEMMLVIRDPDVVRAKNWALITTHIEEDSAVVLTVRPR